MAELIIVATACLAIGFVVGVVVGAALEARFSDDYDIDQHRGRA